MTSAEFRHLLEMLADAWRRGDARAAADCFAEDAVYTEPPDRQVYRAGRSSTTSSVETKAHRPRWR
jgi:ketosteroid isomerase-like protein